ncbi:MAG: hypothetical protein P3X24_009110, partial [bacterium]|nr:hypothetical protein [bacterium]
MTTEVLKDVPKGLTRERIEQQARALGEPEWHIQRRLEAYDRFLQLPIPTPKQEDWRYTDITTLHLEDYVAVAWSDSPRGNPPTQLPPFLTDTPINNVYQRAGCGFESHIPESVLEQGVQERDLHEEVESQPYLLESNDSRN